MRRRIMAVLAALVVAAGLTAMAVTHASAAAPKTQSVYLTMYGWPDNDPPGPAIAYPRSDGYPTLHNQAGGTGTYSDPITVAVATGYLAPGTRVYITAYRKYAMVEDECASCSGAWIDMWVGGQGVAPGTVLQREDDLTLDQTRVVINPPPGYPTDLTQMLDPGVKPGSDTPPGTPPPPAPTPTATATPTAPPLPAKPGIARVEVHGSTVIFLWHRVPAAERYEWGILRNGRWEHSGSTVEGWLAGYITPWLPREFRVRACDASACGPWATATFVG